MNGRSKRVIDLTLDELLDAVEDRVRQTLEAPDATTPEGKEPKRYVYGLRGLQEIFGCSKTTASRLKASGKIDEAITQVGSLIIIDADKALELAGRPTPRKK